MTDGKRVRVLLNVAHIDDLAAISPEHCDGIGLVRTELLLPTMAELRDEDFQFERYRQIAAWAQGRPVTFRTLDAGGDKPLDGYTREAERNPFLGVRGVRLSLLHPDVLEIQLRALARAAAVANVNIMVPMVTLSAEFERVRALLASSLPEDKRGLLADRVDGLLAAFVEQSRIVHHSLHRGADPSYSK